MKMSHTALAYWLIISNFVYEWVLGSHDYGKALQVSYFQTLAVGMSWWFCSRD